MKWVDDGEKWGDDMMGQDDAHEPPPKATDYCGKQECVNSHPI